MCESIDAVAGLLNLPGEIVYLLIGLMLGMVLGWIIGRQRTLYPNVQTDETVAVLPSSTQAISETKSGGVSLVVNGKMVEVEPAVMEDIQALIIGGNKIEAIKRLRDASGLNLAAAKSVVESLEKVIH